MNKLPYKNFTNEERIGEPMDKSYFITIRKHRVKDFVDVQEIMNILEKLYTVIPSLRLGINIFEIDKKYNQLHYHAIVKMENKYFNYKTASSFNGFRIYWSPIYSHCGLKKYIQKDVHNKYQQEEIINNNFYLHPEAPNRFI